MASNDDDLTAWAKALTTRAFSSYHNYYGLCTASCQVYDTAWVAMISKTEDDVKKWLFPECFYYLLKTQSPDGSWGRLGTTQTAGILDTSAALLALLRHAKEPLQLMAISPNDISQRIERGFFSLQLQLSQWDDVEKSNHIGVELIVPALFSYLQRESENDSLVLDFPCKMTLECMHKEKMSQFNLSTLYAQRPSSALHSLEAFLGKLDFDRVSHHMYHGSMMASPSSTAAYLIGASQWSDEAESYLRHIVSNGAGHGDGGIPGTYPTTHFECSWILATLLQAGFHHDDIECEGFQGLVGILRASLEDEGGIIGFAPHTADVDDTAKALLALKLSGQHVSPDTMIKIFERKDHFTTFCTERDPSLTSNLHVLLCLLHQPAVSQYSSQIVKATRFICQVWWHNDHRVKDKWNLSHLYPSMLLAEALTKLILVLDSGELLEDIDFDLRCRLSVSLFQACLRIMLDQSEDGSWDGSQEQTCYAILALSHARHVSFFDDLRHEIQACMNRGVAWLRLRSSMLQPEDLPWTSKTAYNVAFVAEVYKVAALKAANCKTSSKGDIGHSLPFSSSLGELEGYLRLVRQTALFAPLEEWQVRASLIESSFFVPLLQAQRLLIYPREGSGVGEDKYLSIIPFTWVGCNNRNRTFASASWMYDMMMLSLLGYQTDEFIEAVAGPAFGKSKRLHSVIDQVFNSLDNKGLSLTRNGNTECDTPNALENISNQIRNTHDSDSNSSAIECVKASLTKFVKYVTNHESVCRSSSWDREQLVQECRTFLHAHATQLEDNARFASQKTGDILDSPAQTYYNWVRTTGGNHVACAYSLTFSNCLVSANIGHGKEVYPTVVQKYLSNAIARHLTTMCRIYNDFGSISRDSDERNVNSIHFPEFSDCVGQEGRKKCLAQLGEYESACLNLALHELSQEISRRQTPSRIDFDSRNFSILRLFCDVTDLYDQLYVIRDLSSAIKVKGGS
ncbi:hypothetical protein E4U57_000255 [Claviceps arundinis]|uniref:Ent-kaurene synthase n=1 Tax=Claviceps arundinis TaxID=1623583 RepID=A0ABQ7PF81_9HYPO|nr:hypothetical protein E4U57_000255 [Claviceps arundinis]